MTAALHGSYQTGTTPAGNWVSARLSRRDELFPLVESVTDAMAALGYPADDLFAVRLALEEALDNAIKHGNGGDPARQVQLRYLVDRDQVLMDVEDEGDGFNPDSVPDPTAPENLLRTGGRGLHLMRCFMTTVHHGEGGNSVHLCKRPSAPLTPR